MEANLGIATVMVTPLSLGGLEGTGASSSVSPEGCCELDLFRQSGREYDFLTRRGMRDCATGSGITTQESSKWTWAWQSGSQACDESVVDIVADGEEEMVVVVKRVCFVKT